MEPDRGVAASVESDVAGGGGVTFISSQKVFAHLDRLVGWNNGQTPAPVTIEFDLSNRCHLGCTACHFSHTHSRGPWAVKDRRLPMAFTETGDYANPAWVTRALTQMAQAGVRGVVWTGGGEPTMHPHILTIAKHAASVGLEQGLYTSGGMLRQDTAAELAEYLTWAVVSLDCADPITYHHEKGVPLDKWKDACNGVRWLSAPRKATIGVSFLMHAGNYHRMTEMLALSRSLGSTYTTFRPTIEDGPMSALATVDRTWIDSALPALRSVASEPDVECDPARFEAYRDWQGRSYAVCHGIKLNATVTPDGRMWVCPQRRGIEGSQLGDLKTESFAEIWARHPGQWNQLGDCRVMCRLHQVNEALAPVFAVRAHEAFV
jgi:MoaA/NifB/PqqE/SkfB family radical SAM enzyme